MTAFKREFKFNDDIRERISKNIRKYRIENGITQEQFLEAAERGLGDNKYKKYFEQILKFSDYNFFKGIMTKRNYQIIKRVEEQMAQKQKEEEAKKKEEIERKKEIENLIEK